MIMFKLNMSFPLSFPLLKNITA